MFIVGPKSHPSTSGYERSSSSTSLSKSPRGLSTSSLTSNQLLKPVAEEAGEDDEEEETSSESKGDEEEDSLPECERAEVSVKSCVTSFVYSFILSICGLKRYPVMNRPTERQTINETHRFTLSRLKQNKAQM